MRLLPSVPCLKCGGLSFRCHQLSATNPTCSNCLVIYDFVGFHSKTILSHFLVKTRPIPLLHPTKSTTSFAPVSPLKHSKWCSCWLLDLLEWEIIRNLAKADCCCSMIPTYRPNSNKILAARCSTQSQPLNHRRALPPSNYGFELFFPSFGLQIANC